MFSIRLENIAPLLNATSLLTQISNEADVKFSRLTFSIIARHGQPSSSRFVAIMFMPHPLFATFSVNRTHISRVSLQSFHNALLEGQNYSSMTIHLLERLNRIILRFETSGHTPRLRRQLTLSPIREDLVLGRLSNKYFSIDSQEFRHIVAALSAYHDQTICVTVTSSQVKFTVADEEIILTKEGGQCLILGQEVGEGEVQLLITLHPTSFFINLANQASRIWFFKTNDSRAAINIPFQVYAQYLIYFSQR